MSPIAISTRDDSSIAVAENKIQKMVKLRIAWTQAFLITTRALNMYTSFKMLSIFYCRVIKTLSGKH